MPFQLVKLVDPIQLYITGTFTPRGAYAGGTDYAVGDMVSYLGSSYIMYVDAVAGTLPTDTSKWGIVASKGDTGATGAPGADGADGAAGAAGANGAPGAAGADGADGVVQSIVAGTNVTVDATDPANPIVSSSGGGSSLIIQEDDVTVVAAAATLDFLGADFDVSVVGTEGNVALAADVLRDADVGVQVQAYDADLGTIAGLTPSNDDFIQRKSGLWTNRSVAQVKTDLSLSGSNTGDQTITLTGDVTGTGTGSFAASIGNDKVTTAMIADQDLKDVAGITRTRGDLIVGGASAWVDLAVGASGRMLGSDGTDPVWHESSRVWGYGGATVTNTTTQTTLMGFPTNIAANQVRVGDVFELTAGGTLLNNTGSNQTLSLETAPFTGATLTTGNIATGTTSRIWHIYARGVFTALGTPGAAAITGKFSMSGLGGATGWDTLSAAGYDYIISFTTTPITTSSMTVNFKVTLGTASTNFTMVCHQATWCWTPKNV